MQYGHQTHVPDNCQFALEDASKGLPYSDGYFDVVHMRILAAGVSATGIMEKLMELIIHTDSRLVGIGQ